MLRDVTSVAYVAVAVVFVWISVVTWQRRAHNPTVALSLIVVMLALSVSSLADAVALASGSERVAAVASLAILPGTGLASGAFACLAFGVARPHWEPPRWLLVVMVIEPALISVAVATNRLHLLVYTGVGARDLTGSEHWGYGAAFWWHAAYCYAALALGVAFLAWGAWRSPTQFRRQRLTILLATVIACGANALYLSRGFGDLIDPTPFGFAVTGLAIFYALFRQDLITVNPVAPFLVIDQLDEAVVVVSPDGTVLDLNPTAVDLLHAVNPAAPTRLVGESAQRLFGDSLTTPAGGEKEIIVELTAERREFQVRASVLLDRSGRNLGTAYVARDVTDANNHLRRLAAAHAELVRQVETIDRLRGELAELAWRDPLTGLYNRRRVVDEVASMIAVGERTGATFAVVLVDIDGFKSVNDEHGHLAGDAALVALARLLEECAPPGALVARWGGDEFFVAVPGADVTSGVAFADDVRRRCELTKVPIDGELLTRTLSVGVASYPEAGRSLGDLFHAVDRSMYEAKRAGRNLVRAHDPGSTAGAAHARDDGARHGTEPDGASSHPGSTLPTSVPAALRHPPGRRPRPATQPALHPASSGL